MTFHYKQSAAYHTALCGRMTADYKTTYNGVNCCACLKILMNNKRKEADKIEAKINSIREEFLTTHIGDTEKPAQIRMVTLRRPSMVGENGASP